MCQSTRIYLIDYGLESVGGHHYSSASVLHYTAREMGAKLVVLVPRNSFPPKIGSNSEALEILSVLSHKQYDTPLAINNSGGDFFRAFNTRRMAFQRDLTSWLSDLVFPEDVVLLSTPLTPELAGFTDWLKSVSICQRPAVAVLFVLPVEFELGLTWRGNEALRKTYIATESPALEHAPGVDIYWPVTIVDWPSAYQTLIIL